MKNIVFLLLLLPILSFSQDLDKHRWEDRLILVLADSYKNPKLVKQLKEFKNKSKSLEERKLIVYQITPTSYQTGIDKNTSTKSNAVYKEYNPSNEDFKIILIGLDGGIKLKSNKVLLSTQIFDQIDQMPMRRQELRIKN
ncbi:DUF4174 domain-containing protein [Aquimarina sp. AD1]|uniref:DUF4174 domain-containing protein n=1 Tax=Aquimarina sp. (strain AD1) TaxID=1714848 RepID=UPI000E53D922|nr:DUF4174 domain-containing protein [Aquimarina sp. AD1]AXT55771.1 DUF4174 domain-containing protein [Aquimarina sp. AD1]RKN31375.1 DUF4174 domain-containing protein [Aquimarina sp. AD1]